MRLRLGNAIIKACILIMAVALTACNGKSAGRETLGGEPVVSAQGQSGALSEDMQALLEEIDWDAQDEEAWQDNTLDAWMASTHQELSFKGMAGTKPLGRWVDDVCMTPDGISVFMSRAFIFVILSSEPSCTF